MGYYIEVPANKGKALLLHTIHGAELLPGQPRWEDVPGDRALIVVVDNGIFEAAGYAYDEAEFRAFTQPGDLRRKEFLLMDKEQARELAGTRR